MTEDENSCPVVEELTRSALHVVLQHQYDDLRFLAGRLSHHACLHLRVQSISTTASAFAALMQDGSVVTWGNPLNGGNSDAVRDQLGHGVRSISATEAASAAIKSDGSVVTWGDPHSGGDSAAVRDQLARDVQSISASGVAFAAIKSGGSVVTWGNVTWGGGSEAVRGQLGHDVQSIGASFFAFAAIQSGGRVVTWGGSLTGGDSDAVRDQLGHDVRSINATEGAFAAIKSDGSVVTWGLQDDGGDSEAVRFRATPRYAAWRAVPRRRWRPHDDPIRLPPRPSGVCLRTGFQLSSICRAMDSKIAGLWWWWFFFSSVRQLRRCDVFERRAEWFSSREAVTPSNDVREL